MRLGFGFGLPATRTRTLLSDGLGPELIANGNFADSSVWTLGIGWSIFAELGVRTSDASSGSITQPVSFTAGRTYRVTFKLSGPSGGFFAAGFLGGTTRNGTTRTVDGTYTEDMVANTGNVIFRIIASGGAGGVIDDVSVREVLS